MGSNVDIQVRCSSYSTKLVDIRVSIRISIIEEAHCQNTAFHLVDDAREIIHTHTIVFAKSLGFEHGQIPALWIRMKTARALETAGWGNIDFQNGGKTVDFLRFRHVGKCNLREIGRLANGYAAQHPGTTIKNERNELRHRRAT